MAEPLFYLDRSDILDGRLAEVRDGMRELAGFVRAREPRLIAYHLFVDETESTMSVLAVHPDSASLDLHLRVGGPRFRAFGALVRMRSMDVYGSPDPAVVDALREKAEYLGGATLTLHAWQAGFSRLLPPIGSDT
ncbi:hypothetical protein ACIQ6Y_28350 [Streptomyces sp. NPDC096205]|uniref:hypothetical protein n=1 Tax=Streptomyces sp. NPDC096205 TaxID=3366081 RepID=UPI0037F2B136